MVIGKLFLPVICSLLLMFTFKSARSYFLVFFKLMRRLSTAMTTAQSEHCWNHDITFADFVHIVESHRVKPQPLW